MAGDRTQGLASSLPPISDFCRGALSARRPPAVQRFRAGAAAYRRWGRHAAPA